MVFFKTSSSCSSCPSLRERYLDRVEIKFGESEYVLPPVINWSVEVLQFRHGAEVAILNSRWVIG